MKSKGLQPRLLYPARLSFKIEGEIKTFPDKMKVRVVDHHKTSITKMLKRLLKEKERKRGTNM